MPAARAASSREAPSSTRAKASIRREAAVSRHRLASRRSSPAPSSFRVIATVMAPPPIGHTADQPRQAPRGSGRDDASAIRAVGITQCGSVRGAGAVPCGLSLAGSAAMSRAAAGLPAGIRVSDHVSLGVIARTFPLDQVRRVLAETGKASERERDLPAHVMVYYAIALALYMPSGTREVLRCLLEGLRWLWGAEAVRVAGRSGISQPRTRLGAEPLRRLYERAVRPIATRTTRGAWYRRWRLVSLDGSCLDVADTAENSSAFGRPGAGRGESAFPQLRFVALVENGTH